MHEFDFLFVFQTMSHLTVLPFCHIKLKNPKTDKALKLAWNQKGKESSILSV
jgi:hypothetical protein